MTAALVAHSVTEGPLLWFLNRGTGVALIVILTLSVLLGIVGAGRNAGGALPAFVPQSLHRNLSILALALTTAHAITAVADEFVDIRWWQAISPFGATYKPLWLGLGTLAFDLMVLLAFSTLARRALGHQAWVRIHQLGYAVWPLAFAHGAGIGTDAGLTWVRWLSFGCAGVLLVAIAFRLGRRHPVDAVLPVRMSRSL